MSNETHTAGPPGNPDHDRHAHLAQLLVGELRDRIRAGEPSPAAEFTNAPRDAFDDYELLEEVARGGMGVVYKARQVSLNRIVALKAILAGRFATPREVQRFQTEVEAAAKLDHPGIVPVFAVGQRGAGWFYSMAYIEGTSLAQRIADGPLPPKRAADLIRQSAEAIAYAHAQGVIHRDLKPANILLDSGDRPRVTDFGLAKQVAVDSGLTATGDIVGTPSYMPPEQARGNIDQIGPSSDIYALGATLYCLITGRPPFQAASAMETLQQVLNEEPVSPRRLNPAVDIDLETICLKCLQKEGVQRYTTAADLANDLSRYLDGHPILARPISLLARAARWSRRNRALAATATGLFLALSGGTIISAYFAIEATANAEFYRKEKIRADEEVVRTKVSLEREQVALRRQQTALEETERVIDDYVRTIKNSELLKDSRFRPLLNELLVDALAHYKQFVDQHVDDRNDAARAKLANALSTVGWIALEFGSDALEAQRANVHLREQMAQENPGMIEHQVGLAESLTVLGHMLLTNGKASDALANWRRALSIREQLSEMGDIVGDHRDALAQCNGYVGVGLAQIGDLTGAAQFYKKSESLYEHLVRDYPGKLSYRASLADCYAKVAESLIAEGRTREAANKIDLALSMHEVIVRDDPTNIKARSGLASSYRTQGHLFRTVGETDKCLEAYQKARSLHRALMEEHPNDDGFLVMLMLDDRFIGLETKDLSSAIISYKASLVACETLLSRVPSNLFYQNLAAEGASLLGFACSQLRDLEQTRIACARCVAIIDGMKLQDFQEAQHFDVADRLNRVGMAYERIGDDEDAREAYEAAITAYTRVCERLPEHTGAATLLAKAHMVLGMLFTRTSKLVDAIHHHTNALQIRERIVEKNLGNLEYESSLAETLIGVGFLNA